MIKVFVNNVQRDDTFTLMNFPAGEPHVKMNIVPELNEKVDIILKGSDLNEYAQVFMMHNVLIAYGIYPGVFIPYLAGARADRDITLGWYPYALMASQFGKLTIADIHSDLNLDFFDAGRVMRTSEILPPDFTSGYDILIAPDAGAIDRTASVAHESNIVLHMDKVRNQDTGRITSYSMNNSGNVKSLKGGRALVVDDICDGGMTFKLLADSLRQFGLKQLDLYVTHGVFSGNARENLSAYDNVYTTNSLESAYNVEANIIDIERIYLEHSGTIPD